MEEQKQEESRVNLDRMDTYPDGKVPDEDVETALKVLRTIRDVAIADLGAPGAAELALHLSLAHKCIYTLVGQAQEGRHEQFDYMACFREEPDPSDCDESDDPRRKALPCERLE